MAVSRFIYRALFFLFHTSNISMLLLFCGALSHRTPWAYMSKIYLPINFSADTSRLSVFSLYCMTALYLMCQPDTLRCLIYSSAPASLRL